MAKTKDTMVVGIDIGSGHLRALGALRREDTKYPKVLVTYKVPLEGVDKGNIIEKESVQKSLEDALLYIEDETGYRASHTLVSINAVGLSSYHASGYAQVSRGDASITDLDIDNAIKDGHRAIADIRNKTVVHAIPMDYKVDGNKIHGEILGVRGNKLETRTLYVTYPLQCMNVLQKTLDGARIEVTDIVAGPIAESIPLLTKKQKIAGVALINIGHSVTSLLVYEKNTPHLISTIPTGGEDIIKDIALGMKITLEEAEDILNGRSVTAYSKRRVEEIIEARLEDLSKKITRELSRIMRAELLPAGVVVGGSYTHIPRLEYVLRNELKLPITILSSELVRLGGDHMSDTTFARAYGLTFLAPNDTEKDVLKELLTIFVTRVKKIISQFLP